MSELALSKPERTTWERARKVFRGHPLALVGLIGISCFILLAIFAPLIAPQDPYDQSKLDILDGLLPPGSVMFDGTYSVMGTDALGRDILSAVIYGLRISLFVAFTAVIVGSSIGVLLGLMAAYNGRWVDTVIMRAVDLKMSFPGILMALMLLALFGTGVDKVIYALIIAAWASKAR